MNAPSRRMTSGLLVGAVALVAAVPLLLGAAGDGDGSQAESRRRIAGMSQAEREELDRKYAAWKALDPAEREALRQLHADLQADERLGGPLAETLVRYERWLGQLSPWQRAALRAESDPYQRTALVRQTEKERADEQEQRQREWESRDRRDRGPFHYWALWRLPKLSEEQLAQAMPLIEAALPPDPQIRERLQSVDGSRRHLRTLTAALRQAAADQRPETRWPPPELLAPLLDQFADESERRMLEPLPLEQRQALMVRILVWSIVSHRRDQLRSRNPTESELVQVISSLDEQRREELLEAPEWHRNQALRFHWGRQQSREIEPDLNELATVFVEMFPQWHVRAPFNDGRRGERRFRD